MIQLLESPGSSPAEDRFAADYPEARQAQKIQTKGERQPICGISETERCGYHQMLARN
jgi:hypothetical protein